MPQSKRKTKVKATKQRDIRVLQAACGVLGEKVKACDTRIGKLEQTVADLAALCGRLSAKVEPPTQAEGPRL